MRIRSASLLASVLALAVFARRLGLRRRLRLTHQTSPRCDHGSPDLGEGAGDLVRVRHRLGRRIRSSRDQPTVRPRHHSRSHSGRILPRDSDAAGRPRCWPSPRRPCPVPRRRSRGSKKPRGFHATGPHWRSTASRSSASWNDRTRAGAAPPGRRVVGPRCVAQRIRGGCRKGARQTADREDLHRADHRAVHRADRAGKRNGG